jgi:hypothetical protein
MPEFCKKIYLKCVPPDVNIYLIKKQAELKLQGVKQSSVAAIFYAAIRSNADFKKLSINNADGSK